MTNDRQARAARAEQMRKERDSADRKQRNIISLSIVGVVIVLVALGAWGVKSAADKNQKQTDVIVPANSVDGGVPASEAGASAAVTVDIYEDFLCPHCATFENESGEWLRGQAADGAINVVNRPFPFMDLSKATNYSRKSANLAICALDSQGVSAYQTLHSALFANQPAGNELPSTDQLLQLAKDNGITGLDECMKTEKFHPWLDDITKTARDDRGITGTPAVFINGEQVEDWTLANLQKAVEDAKAGSGDAKDDAKKEEDKDEK